MAISEEARRNHDALFPDQTSTLRRTEAHVAANLAAGNDRQMHLGTVTALLPFIGYPRSLNAIRVIRCSLGVSGV